MGIKHLHKFIKRSETIIELKPNTNYFNKSIAIDISILIYKLVIAIRSNGTDLLNREGQIISHIISLYDKTLNFLEMGITPIFVFDGKPPSFKNTILLNRQNIRKYAQLKMDSTDDKLEKIKYFKRTVHVTKKQMEECKEMLSLMGLPVIQAPEEADSQCAYLAKLNLVYGVLTNDTDILVHGAPKIITNISSKQKTVCEINLDSILSHYEISYEQFIDMCILFGSDYNSVKNVNYYKAFQLIQKFGSIEEIIDGNEIKLDFDYKKIRRYFTKPHVTKIADLDLTIKKPNYVKLFDFMVNKFKLSRAKTTKKINKLEQLYNSKYQNILICN